MRYRPDFAVYSPDSKLQVVVEVKAVPERDADWAAKLRRNLVAHQEMPVVPYFILALPDQLYVWRDGHVGGERAPDLALRTQQLLRQYCAWQPHGLLTESALELYIFALLEELTHLESVQPGNDVERALADLGLLDAIRAGEVKAEGPV